MKLNNKTICPSCGKENNSHNNDNCNSCNQKLLLNEKYFLIKVLGKNIGITYLAIDLKSNKNVVIKELSIKKIKEWKDKELFKREADILLSINHKEIPKFIDYFEISIGRIVKYYTVMEFIDGLTLYEEKKGKIYTEADIFQILKEIADILDYLHNLKPAVIHRDIKPKNIIRRRSDNKLVLIDFGSVVDILKPEGDNTIAGTFGYMAPEQFAGMASFESDYYSLGVVLLVLLTKKEPEYFIESISLSLKKLDSFSISKKMRNILSFMITDNIEDRVSNIDDINHLLGISRSSLANSELIDAVVKYQIIYSKLKNRKKRIIFRNYYNNKFISKYLNRLNVKEIVLLEIVISLEDISLNKENFYKIYQDFIDNGKVNFKDIIDYSKLYKENGLFNLLNLYNIINDLFVDFNKIDYKKIFLHYQNYKNRINNNEEEKNILSKRGVLYQKDLNFKLLVDLYNILGRNKRKMRAIIFFETEESSKKIISILRKINKK